MRPHARCTTHCGRAPCPSVQSTTCCALRLVGVCVKDCADPRVLWDVLLVGWACFRVKDGDSQRVWLFTNDDNPNPDDGGLRDQTIQKAKDLVELGQDLTLWYMSRPDLEFNVRLFFAGIIPVDEDDPESGIQDISQLDDVVSRVRRKEHRKRAVRWWGSRCSTVHRVR